MKVRDEDIESEVKKAFEKADFKDISVEVKNGVVRLTGTVSDRGAAPGGSSARALDPGRARGQGRSAPRDSQGLTVPARYVRMNAGQCRRAPQDTDQQSIGGNHEGEVSAQSPVRRRLKEINHIGFI